MKIVVLAKQVPDTWSNRKLNLETGILDRAASDPVPDEINERALENALQYKDAVSDTEIIVVSMGTNDTSKSLLKLLSMGADSAVLVSDLDLTGADMMRTSRMLASTIQKIGADLVISGNESTDGRSGMVPAMVAELLGWPILPGLDELQITSEGVTGLAKMDGGMLNLSHGLPAMVSVTERSAEARFPNFKGIRQAKKKPMVTWSIHDLGVQPLVEHAEARSVMVSASARPPKEAGPKITDDGSAAAKLADFLISNRLV